MSGLEVTRIDWEGASRRLTLREAVVAGNGYVFATVTVGTEPSFTAVEIKTNFLFTARAGDLVVGRSWSVHLGRTTQVWDATITITNATAGRDMALFRNTPLVLPAR